MVTRNERNRIRAAAQALADTQTTMELGFQVYMSLVARLERVTPPEQQAALREAFRTGAAHMWTTMMAMMEDGTLETDKDLERIGQKLHREVTAIDDELRLKYGAVQGRA